MILVLLTNLIVCSKYNNYVEWSKYQVLKSYVRTHKPDYVTLTNPKYVVASTKPKYFETQTLAPSVTCVLKTPAMSMFLLDKFVKVSLKRILFWPWSSRQMATW